MEAPKFKFYIKQHTRKSVNYHLRKLVLNEFYVCFFGIMAMCLYIICVFFIKRIGMILRFYNKIIITPVSVDPWATCKIIAFLICFDYVNSYFYFYRHNYFRKYFTFFFTHDKWIITNMFNIDIKNLNQTIKIYKLVFVTFKLYILFNEF